MALGIELFDIVDRTGALIQDNVEDINYNRKNSRWVYPTFPVSKKNLPQVTIELGSPSYEVGAGGEYLGEDNSGSTYKVFKFMKATSNMKLYVISGKEQEFEVTYNNEKLYLSNQKLNIFIANQVKDYIQRNNKEFLKFSSRYNLTDIELSFENDDYSWASVITCEVQYKDVWVEEYIDGLLISSYSLQTQTY